MKPQFTFPVLPPVGKVMTLNPFSLALDDSLRTAMQLMSRHHISHLPVMEGERLAGILSERDLLRRRSPGGPTDLEAPDEPVHLSCARSVVTARPDDCPHHAAGILVSEQIHALVIVAEGGADSNPARLVGMLTMGDLVRCLVAAEKKLGGSSGERTWTASGSVEAAMTREVVTVGPKSELGDALKHFSEGKIRHLPIVQGERILGILSDRDLLRALHPRRPAPKSRGRARVLADESGDLALSKSVRELMATGLITASAKMSLFEGAKALCRRRIDALPVVDDKQKLLGILTTSDYLSFFAGAKKEHCPDGRHPESV